MHITDFKQGDIVTRNEPASYPTGTTDFSYMGDPIELVGFENDLIVAKINGKKDILPMLMWGNGWTLYPTKLMEEENI